MAPKIFAVLLTTGLMLGCSATQKSDTQNLVAIVNGYKVSSELLDYYCTKYAGKVFDDLNKRQREKKLDALIKLVMLATYPKSQGLYRQKYIIEKYEFNWIRENAQKRVRQFTNDMKISEAEMQAAYRKRYLVKNVEYNGRHILLKTKAEAYQVIKELKSGADFEALARKKSVGPTASRGGSLGWFSERAMVKPFREAIAKMQPGEISKSPVRTQFGFHIIKIEGKRYAPVMKFEEVKSIVKSMVVEQKLKKFLNETESQSQVKIFSEP